MRELGTGETLKWLHVNKGRRREESRDRSLDLKIKGVIVRLNDVDTDADPGSLSSSVSVLCISLHIGDF